MYEIPTTIIVGDTEYTIRCRGDYRMVLDCFDCLNDTELTQDERIFACLIIFYEDFNDVLDLTSLDTDTVTSLIKEMFNFFSCGEESMRKLNYRVIDWRKDSQMVCSAINKVAHTEIRELEYLHWWTFLGYFSEVGESVLSTVVGIRNKIKKGKKLEKYEKEFKASNPNYFIWDSQTLEDKQDLEDILNIWDKE